MPMPKIRGGGMKPGGELGWGEGEGRQTAGQKVKKHSSLFSGILYICTDGPMKFISPRGKLALTFKSKSHKVQSHSGHVMNKMDRANKAAWDQPQKVKFKVDTNKEEVLNQDSGHIKNSIKCLTYQSQEQKQNTKSVRLQLWTHSSEKKDRMSINAEHRWTVSKICALSVNWGVKQWTW